MKWLFLDLETTGLNPKMDSILECGVVLFDPEARKVLGHASWLFRPAREPMRNAKVEEMHTKNGLWEAIGYRPGELLKDYDQPDNVFDYHQLQSLVVDFLGQYNVEKKGAMLCGNSLNAVDVPFLRRYAPQLIAFLSHRMIDVTSVWATLDKLRPDLCPDKPDGDAVAHRALDDARMSMMFLLEMVDGLS